MLKEYMMSYIESSIKALEDMFSVETGVEKRNYTLESSFRPPTDFVVQIPFYGEIAGDYFLSIEKDKWATMFERLYGSKGDELLFAAIKEYLNTVVGSAILPLVDDFPGMCYASPRIIKCIDYPDIKTMHSSFRTIELGQIHLALSIDLMKLDIGLELDEALTELKLKNKQLVHSDRLSTLGTMSASIMHELNNPSTFISGNIQSLQSRFFPVIQKYVEKHGISEDEPKLGFVMDEIPKICSSVLEGIQRIQNIAGSMTEFSRSSCRNPDFVNLNRSLEKAITLSKLSLTNRVTVTLTDVILPEIKGDGQQIEQVIINLIVNAGHALEETKNPKVDIIAKVEDDYCIIDIVDNGPGVSKSSQEKIFQPFFTTKPAGIGTGLGLSISTEIIEAHGGELSHRDAQPNGACFSIKLPIHS